MKILILGVNGFIGSNLTSAILGTTDWEVYGMDMASDKLGAAVAALPLVTVLTLIWLYVEHQPESKLADHASYTFWYVLPTLPMFLVLPWLLPRLGFWLTLVASAVLTIACFLALAFVLRRFGVLLLP